MIWSNIASFFLDWKVKVGIILIVLSSLYFWHRAEIRIAVNKKGQEITQQIAKENFKLTEKSLATTATLQESISKQIKDKNAEIKTLTSRVSVLTSSLQSRPNRPEPSGVPTDSRHSESQPGATGLQLYREDSLFLTREAARADEIRINLQSCYKQYDEVKETLDKYRADNSPRTN